ncbi:hypothetical protein AAG570_008805 [Ranatra chinensis]|uniref:G-protein coupled receptors family 1 profile domain-containing protein n=1 Tax=Ranatra chinensis TaxID=642074 RepID=A0ABD0ZD50_9HEMI
MVRNATAVFIINLSVSDLMSCCFNLPLAASTFWSRAWCHGLLLCRLFPLLRYGLLAVSLFTVLAITINRYVMIGHPTLYPKRLGTKLGEKMTRPTPFTPVLWVKGVERGRQEGCSGIGSESEGLKYEVEKSGKHPIKVRSDQSDKVGRA